MRSYLGSARSRASLRRRTNQPWPHRRLVGEWLEQRAVLSANLNFAIAGVPPGGQLAEQGFAVRTDAAGNVYELTEYDVIKYDASGKLQWDLPFTASSNLGLDTVFKKEGLAVDSSGDIYITGNFSNGLTGQATFGSTSLVSAGGSDGFLAKISPSGSFVWAESFGGTNDDTAYEVATDAAGNAYLTGHINGTATIGSGTNTRTFSAGNGQDILVAKFDGNGTLDWANVYGNGGISNDGRGIAVDGQGNAYVTGGFSGTMNFGATQLYSFFGSAFLLKLNTSGRIQWAEKLNTEPDPNYGMAQGYAIAADAAGNIYATGQFGGDVDLNPNGGDLVTIADFVFEDTYVLKLDTSGNFIWADDLHHVAGLGGLRADDIAVSPQGNVYTTGWYEGTANFAPNSQFLQTSTSADDIFVSALNSNGTFLWAATAGQTFSDEGYGVAVSPGAGGDYVYAVGTFSNGVNPNATTSYVNFNSGLGPADLVTANGTWDSFLWGLDSLQTRINGLVWDDQNGDGVRQSSEPGVPNVTVQLFYGAPGSGTQVATTVTDPLGLYSFNGVAPGNQYYVQVAPVGGDILTAENAGADLTIASNVSSTTGDSDPISITAGQTALVNAGLQNIVSPPAINRALGILTSGFTYGSGVVADAAGDYYVSGSFAGLTTLGSGAGAVTLKTTYAPNDFIAKYAANGTLLWARQFVSDFWEYYGKIMLDSSGNVYVAGEITGNATLGTIPLTAGGIGNSVFLAKLDGNGNPVWANTVLANAVNPNVGLAVDPKGNAYVVGGFSKSATVFTSPVTTLTSAGGTDAFIVKYSPLGVAQWAKSYGGTGDDAADSATIDPAGNPVTTGTFTSPAQFGGIALTGSSGFANDFVAKINSTDGSVAWAVPLTSTVDSGPALFSDLDPTSRIAVDSAGNVYTTGEFSGTIQLDPTGGTDAINGSDATFVSKLDSSGNFVWGKAFVSPNAYDVEGFGIAVDSSGNVFSTGRFSNTINFDPAGSATGNLISNGSNDVYLSELDANGNFVNVQQYGGSGDDGGSMVSADANGNIYLTGLSYGPAAFGKFTVGGAQDQDIFVARLSSNVTTRANVAPSFAVQGPLQAVALNAPPQTVPNFIGKIVPGLPGEASEVVNFIVTDDNPTLFLVPPAIDASGTLTYTPAPNISGSATVTVIAHNNGGAAGGGSDTSAPQTFPITVNVNHAPSFTAGANVTVNENSIAQVINGWAKNVSAGPPGEVNQTLTFNVAPPTVTLGGPDVMSGKASLFAAGPSIDAAGNLTFTPAANEWGTAQVTVTLQDNGGTANGGSDTSASQTFTITVNLVNQAPSFTAGANQTVNENAGPQSVDGWATNISAGPPSEANQALTFNVTSDSNPTLFAVPPQIDSSGKLTYTPAKNVSGKTTISVDLQDDGGTVRGGQNTSAAQSFIITVNFVNQPPTFISGGDVQVLENSGAFKSVAPWAKSINAGAPQELAQTLTFVVTSQPSTPGLFAVAPSIDAAGNLSFTPATDMFGTAQVSVQLQDNGLQPDGTTGPTAISAPQTFNITVGLVNHAPTFQDAGNQTVNENDGQQSVGWASQVSAGPASEASQKLNFIVNTDNTSLFTSGGQPQVDANGNLTYTPAPDASGVADVSVQLHDDGGAQNGGSDTSLLHTFTITVNFINQVPSFTKGSDQTTHETPGPQNTSWATNISAGAPTEGNQALTFIVTNNNNGLFAANGQPAIDPITGKLTYTPAVYAVGTATVTVQLADDGREPDGNFVPAETSPPQTFTITVTPSNQVPTFTSGPDQVLAGSFSAITKPGWATKISAGAPDESGQTLNFKVSTDNDALFAVKPAIDATTGDLTFTPQPQTSGQAHVTVQLQDDGGIANGGVDTSAPLTFLISINFVNQAPAFTAGANQTVLENGGPQTVATWATSLDAGAADETTQKLNFLVSNSKPSLFSSPPAIAPVGTLTYTPAPDANGVANVTVQLHDDGGTANGGKDTSSAHTFTITITAVNQQPFFTAGTNRTVLENAGTVTVGGWATGINAGAPNEKSQALNFVVSTDNPTLFPTAPTIDPTTGNLIFTPAIDQVGTANFTVHLHDDGGTDSGGQDTSASQKFSVTVLPVNQPPIFTIGQNQVVDEEAGAQSVSDWATLLSPGGPNETAQKLNYVVSTDNPGLFTVPPQIDIATGDLTYTVAPHTSGTAHVSVQLHDDGGTANGGKDTSAPQTSTIAVNFVNDAPSFTLAQSTPTVNENSGNATFWSFASQISASSSYPPDANEGGQTVNFKVTNDNPGLFSTAPTIDPSGNLRFTPAPNVSGTATVTANLQDNGGTANGGHETSAQTFTITVNFVNQAPTITHVGTNPVVRADSGLVTTASFITTASGPGPDGNPQQITYLAKAANTSLFAADGQPAIDANGALTFTPSGRNSGSTSVTVQAQNSGGTANGGNNLSTPVKFFIQVQPGDHAPTVEGKLTAVTVDESMQAFDQVISSLAGVFDDIDVDLKLGDHLALSVSGDTNPSLVTASLSDSDLATAQLDLHFLAGQHGSAVVNLRATDQSGAYVDEPLNITVNQAPTAIDHSYVLGIGPANSVTSGQGALTGDTGAAGVPLTAALVSPPANGTVQLNSDGSFTYTKGPNFAGTDSFTYQISDGITSSNVATVKITSFEATMVTKLYQQVLNRPPDAAGLAYWVNQIEQGQPYGAVAQGIFESPERLDPIIQNYYQQFLGRPADAAGLAYWYGVWVANGGPEPVVTGMIGSPEFYASAQRANPGQSPNAAWVTSLYQRLLNRTADAAGLSYWTSELDSGTLDRGQVVGGFNSSPENYQKLTIGFFQQYLGRAPTSQELQQYVTLFERGASQSDVQIRIIDSPDYSNSPPPPAAGSMSLLS